MKSIKVFAVLTTLAFLTASCVENSGKYKAAVAQRDSLAIEKELLDSSFSQTITLLNDIEAGFRVISENEKQMQFNLKGVEGKSPNQRELITAQMTAIRVSMEQNKAKIAELRRLESKKIKANSQLSETIKLLQSKMDEQSIQIKSLQEELLRKNIRIDELNTIVNDQQNVLEQQQMTLSEQETDKNTAWFCVASTKQLKDAKIVADGGLFQPLRVMKSDFDKKAFTKVDLRTVLSIETHSTNAKILSSHPEKSYKLVEGTDKNITITITNPSSFWSVTKYLVVKI